jgi:hypothetical protein
MKKKIGLIYFIHDDTNEVFSESVVPTILHTSVSEDIKIILIHNVRRQFNLEKDAVTYTSAVKEVVKDTDGFTAFNTLKENILLWEDAFDFAFDYLSEQKYFDSLGLITLSHSNGFVINRNGEVLSTVDAAAQLRSVSFRSIVRKFSDDEVFVNARSVMEKDDKNNGLQQDTIFHPVYTRENDQFCKTYEGLFFAQFADFLRTKLDKFGDKQFDFFISSNCNFQLYDNIFLFSNVARFTMGAQSFSNISFFHFPTIMDAIIATLEKDTESMCKLIFQLCIERYRRHRKEIIKHYFLVDCGEFMSKLNPLFKRMMEIMVEKMKAQGINKRLIQSINLLMITSDDGEIPYFDTLQFFRKAANIIDSSEFDILFDRFEEFSRTSIVSRFVLDGRNLCGFSLYLPRKQAEFDGLLGQKCNYFGRIVNKRVSEFASQTMFDEFLKLLF